MVAYRFLRCADNVAKVANILERAPNLNRLNIRVGTVNFHCSLEEYTHMAKFVLESLASTLRNIDNPRLLGIFDCAWMELHEGVKLSPASTVPLPVKAILVGPESDRK